MVLDTVKKCQAPCTVCFLVFFILRLYMSITQTVEVPASHRLIIDVPCEIPAGPVILTFTPYGKKKGEFEGLLSVSNSTLDFWDNEDDEVWDNV